MAILELTSKDFDDIKLSEIDDDKEVRIGICGNYYYADINAAIQIIKHLKTEFSIREEELR